MLCNYSELVLVLDGNLQGLRLPVMRVRQYARGRYGRRTVVSMRLVGCLPGTGIGSEH
jgi:hypothetical protein